MMNKYLTDGFLTLRPVEPEDAEFMWEVESDSTQWIQISLPAPFSRENLRNYAYNYAADPYFSGEVRLIIVDNMGKRIGIVDLYEMSAQHHTSMVGIYILPEYRGTGFAITALSLLEKYARNILNLRQLAAKVVDSNESSFNLFTKAGYSWVGTLQDWIQSGNKFYSIHLLQKSINHRPFSL